MRAYARKYGADQELWGMVGLLHDFDYEKYPSLEDHPYRGSEILEERGYSEELRRAILSHAEYTGVARVTPMEKALFACDELAGFISACALVKPGKSLAEVEAKSVRKKMKDKAFARSVHREDIIAGAGELGLDLEEHIAFCIEAMKGMKWESPRGPISIDPDTRDIIQNIYIRRVEKVGGELYNTEFATFEAVKDPIKAAKK